MSVSTAAYPTDRSRALPAIVPAGLVAGALDILAAFIHAGTGGTGPSVVLKAVASGVLGRGAFRGGAGGAALGLLLHFTIALGWAAVYYAASRRLPVLVRRPIVSGALYGVVVYWLMQLVVLPLSAAPKFAETRSLVDTAIGMGIHIFCVGLPIALVISRRARG